jgi:predicted lysophospholipase L1 biosynthesis ABC-type transport system permease subunit
MTRKERKVVAVVFASRAESLLLAAGLRAEGNDQLAQALALWRSLGATANVAQGKALLEVPS